MKGDPGRGDAWGEMGTKRAVETASDKRLMSGDEGDDELSEQWGGNLPRQRKRKGGRAEGRMERKRLDHKPRKAGGHITAAKRHELPSADFALPGKGTGPGGKGPGSYPIDTEGRARSALSRASANATPAEEATIRRKVHAKYPDIHLSNE